MAHDPVRGRTVLAGGTYSGAFDDTWEWDGRRWYALGASPRATSGHAMAYDAARQRCVWFGGMDSTGILRDDTWEWDGTVWTARGGVLSPPGRVGHRMTYDAARQRVVLFGGSDDSVTPLGDTWEWDGTNWLRRAPTFSPPGRNYQAMAYDERRQRVVLFGGRTHSYPWNDTWEWDGTNWEHRATSIAPSPRAGGAMTFDPERQRIVLIGGFGTTSYSDTWEWDGAWWSLRDPGTPGMRSRHAMAWDATSAGVLLFGGQGPLGDTWRWNGELWAKLAPANAPAPRGGHAMVCERHRSRILLFGGARTDRHVYGDTWAWDGADWTELVSSSSPSPRTGVAMAYDETRQRVVLFGGRDGVASSNPLGDTWEWDGTTWMQLTPQSPPPPRSDHAMAFDPTRGRTVLVGGRGSQTLSDTWEWDGAAWALRSGGGPYGHVLVYDPGRRRIVMTGGPSPNDTWEWDGATWTRILGSAQSRWYAAAAYDEVRERLVLAGGEGYSGQISPPHTFVYGTRLVPRITEVGSGCAGAAGVPQLTTSGLPVVGRSRFSFDCTGGLPGSFAIVAVALTSADIPLPGGCRIRVDPGTIVYAPGAALSATGFASLPLPIPPDLGLMGVTLHAQGGVGDASMPLGIAFTGGLQLIVGG